MAKRKIITDKDPTLRQTSRPVERVTPRIQQLLDDMLETMRAADGVGLAAPQVGVLRRLVVIEVEEDHPIFLINPEIIYEAGEQEGPEGCLSIPGRSGIVRLTDEGDRARHGTRRQSVRNDRRGTAGTRLLS